MENLVKRTMVTVMMTVMVKDMWRKENPIYFKMWIFSISVFLSVVPHIQAQGQRQRSHVTSFYYINREESS